MLDKFLKKLGVKSYYDLNNEEKEVYKSWEQALVGRKITDEEYRTFLEMELEEAIKRLTEVDLTEEAEVFRKVEVKLIKKIINFLNMPEVERKMLETQINQQIKSIT